MRVPLPVRLWRKAGRARSGGGGNSFSPLTPFPCRRRFTRRNFSAGGSWCKSVIFGKICSSDLVQWLHRFALRAGSRVQAPPAAPAIQTAFTGQGGI